MNSNLNIFSSIDITPKTYYTYESIYFYSNYTNTSDVSLAEQGLCQVNITDITNDFYLNMTYNLTSSLYEYDTIFELPGTYTFTIKCNSSDFNFTPIQLNDTIQIESNSNLTSFDSSLNSTFNTKIGKNIFFYANYTSVLTNISIPNATCNITYEDYASQMLYNSATALYEHNRTFSTSKTKYYNITCNHQNYSKYTYQNSMYITPLFINSNFNTTNAQESSLLLSDFNNNNLTDFLISGDNIQFNISIFEYNNNNFTKLNTLSNSVKPIRIGSIATADLNNNGLIDIITCGSNESVLSGETPQTSIYFNNGTDFIKQNIDIENLQFCSISTTDFNNDGLIDFIIAGTNNSDDTGAKTILYKNTGNNFTQYQTFTGVYHSSIAFLDIDNNGYDDLVVSGRYGSNVLNLTTKIYTNNGTEFSFSQDIINLSYSNIIPFNLNNDAYIDLIISGKQIDNQDNSALTLIYKNNAGTLVNVQNLSGISQGSISVGDINNDGLADIFISGKNISSQPDSLIYINNGTYFTKHTLQLEQLFDSSSALYDYDNDGDLDLFYSGKNDAFEIKTIIYNNTYSQEMTNYAPAPPTILNATYNYSQGKLIINWNDGSDDITPIQGLYYNLEIGTANNEYSILSGKPRHSSNPSNGYIGNMFNKKHIELNVPPANYIIKIQTIDNGLKKSNWTIITTDFCNYAYGDWNITTDCTVTDTITIDNNHSINILDNAKLTLINSIINFNHSKNHTGINIINGTLNLQNTQIINNNISQELKININNHSSFTSSDNSLFSYINFNISSNSVNITETLLENSKLYYSNSHQTIIKDSIIDNGYLNLSYSNITLYNVTNHPIINYSLNPLSYIKEYWYLTLNFSTTNINTSYISEPYLFVNNSFMTSSYNTKIPLLYKKISSTGNETYSNYTFVFSKTKYFTSNISLNISSNLYRTIPLLSTSEPDFEKFKLYPLTTNFTSQALNRNLTFKNAIISANTSYINFTETINYSSINLSKAISINKTNIFVNTTLYPQLNTQSILTFKNLSYKKKPVIFRNNILCTSECSDKNYNTTTKVFTFKVNGFSNYSIHENSKIEWIDKLTTCNIRNLDTTITVKYLNHTNTSIINSNCSITIGPYTDYPLTYNSTLQTHTFQDIITISQEYPFTIKCNTTEAYEDINYTDTIYVRDNIYDARFTETDKNFPNLWNGAVLFTESGLLMTGTNAAKDLYFYNIVGNDFILDATKSSSISPVIGNADTNNAALATFDYNNDGLEDIIVLGTSTEATLKIYKNTGASYTNTFSLTGLKGGSIDIADYNNDGYQDILISGVDSINNPRTIIYKNNKGTGFIEQEFNLMQLKDGTALFVDYNKDNYADIIINGIDAFNNPQTLVYQNIQGTNFTLNNTISSNLLNTYKSSLAIGDINNDKSFDLLIDGSTDITDANTFSALYTNNNNNFDFLKYLNKTYLSSNLFFNYNNDNYTDIYSSGRYDSSNTQGQSFLYNHTALLSNNITGLYYTTTATKDYDNDGDLDLIISSRNSTHIFTKFYENDIQSCIVNTPPSIPNLSATYTNGLLYINWSESTDAQGGSVTYNLKIGNTINTNTYYSGVIPKTSKPNNPGYGNQGFRNNITLSYPKQCMRIYIQAIDNSFMQSDWSSYKEISFPEIANDGIDQNCDGADLVEGGYVSTGSSSSVKANSETIVSDTTTDTETADDNTNEPEPTDDNTNEPEPTDDNTNEQPATDTSSSSSSTYDDSFTQKELQSIIFNSNKTLEHKRNITIGNGYTIIQEQIKNPNIIDLENVNIHFTIPKEIISSASAQINWDKTSNEIFIIEDDPILGVNIPKLQSAKTYYLEYQINKEISEKDISSIIINITHDDTKKEQEEVLEAITKTKEHLNITTDIETDKENNKTKFTVNLDFKNETVLYNVSVYQDIPKCLLHYLNENFIESDYDFEIVDEDPVIVWHFDKVSKDEKIEFALSASADENCTNLAQTYALAKSIFILNKEIHYGPYKTESKQYKPGVILSGIFMVLFTMLLFWFVSFTQTKNDKLRLALFIEKVKYYKKTYGLSESEMRNNLNSDGATQHEIDEIFTKNLFRRMFLHFEIAIEEFLLFILIIINILDALEILPGDFDLIKKIISWTILSYVFYQISITKILFGIRKKAIDIILLFSFFFLILKNFIVYAIGAIQEMNYFVDIITLIVRNSQILETGLFIIGSIMILLCSIYLTFTIEVQKPSTLSLLSINLEKKKIFRRFILFYLGLMLFFTTIYNLVFEWLAIAIDAPLVTLCILGYFILLIKNHQKFSFTNFLSKVGNGLNSFYKDVILLFTKKSYFILGVSGLLILHILTEIGNFIIPYILGKSDSLYLGTTMVEYSKSNLINLIQSGHAPIFSIADLFTNQVSSIFTYQIQNMDNILQIIHLFIQYSLNIIFVVLLFILPGIIWIHMYQYRKTRDDKTTRVQLSKIFIGLFLLSSVVFFNNPAFTVSTMSNTQYSDLIIDKNVVRGIDIQTVPIKTDASYIPLLIGLALFFLPFSSKYIKYSLNNILSLFALTVFMVYILTFFYQLQLYYIEIIKSSYSGITTITSLITINLALMYFLTTIFYIGGLCFLTYGLWKRHEIPFESENNILESNTLENNIPDTINDKKMNHYESIEDIDRYETNYFSNDNNSGNNRNNLY